MGSPDPISSLSEVYLRFSSADPELPNGFAEHAPMGAEALTRLGCDSAVVVAWAARHEPHPLPADGELARVRDELVVRMDDEGWAGVLATEVATLADHVAAHLFHGLIRTAHAARTVAAVDAPWSRLELATGLAAWRHWSGVGPGGANGSGPSVEMSAPVAVVLDAARRGAGAFVRAPSIVNLHAVTGPMAVMALAEHLDAPTLATAARALERSHRRHPEPGPVPVDAAPLDAAEVAALAARWDAHPAKLVEATRRAHRTTDDPIFLAAARAV